MRRTKSIMYVLQRRPGLPCSEICADQQLCMSMGSSTNPVVFRDPFSSEQLTVNESTDSPRTRANSHAVAHTLYPGSTIFSAPGRALSVPRVERMRAAGKSVAKDAGAAGGYGIEMTALPPSIGTPTKEDMALAKWRVSLAMIWLMVEMGRRAAKYPCPIGDAQQIHHELICASHLRTNDTGIDQDQDAQTR